MIVIRDKYIQLAFRILSIAFILTAVFLGLKYLLPLLGPFILAIFISIINEPLIHLLDRYCKIKRKFGAIISLLFTLCIIAFGLTIGVITIYNELLSLQANISTYINSISSEITTSLDSITEYYKNLPYGIPEEINKNLMSLIPKIREMIESVVKYILNTVTSIPKLTVFVTIALLGSYFISSDKKTVTEFLYKQVPERWSKNLSGIKKNAFTAMLAYLKAQMILVTLTFFEASIGFMIIHADYAITMGLLVAISDLVPIFGTSIILVPWILWTFIVGDISKAIGLIVVYYVGVIMRQVLEPKIVGDNLGLHPLVTLVAMYAGLTLYGVLGMFIALFSVITLKSIQDSGIIRIWKN